MGLTIYDKDRCERDRRPKGLRSIRIKRGTGEFFFSPALTVEEGLDSQSRVLFAQDDAKPGIWYLILTGSGSGFQVRTIHNGKKKPPLGINNKPLAGKILDSIKGGASETLLVATKPVDICGAECFRLIKTVRMR